MISLCRTLQAVAIVLLLTGLARAQSQPPAQKPAWEGESTVSKSDEPFFFIQLSDPQLGMFTGDKDFMQETANFEFAVAAVNRLRPAFVVITGDLVNKPGDDTQIAEYLRIIGTIDPTIPVYSVVGNHDIGNTPTPESLAKYRAIFGPDHYTFRHGGFVGIVLNSTLVSDPKSVPTELSNQDAWLRTELKQASEGGAGHIVVFQHHSWFLTKPDEEDQYFNLPSERRAAHIALFSEFGVKYVFCGHFHRNAIAKDGEIEVVTTAPVGMPLGGESSGLRVVIVREDRLDHRFYHFGQIPNAIDLKPADKKDSRPMPVKSALRRIQQTLTT